MARAAAFLGWYHDNEQGERIGPIPVEEVVRLLDKGILQSTDRVWKAWQDDSGIYFYMTTAGSAREAT